MHTLRRTVYRLGYPLARLSWRLRRPRVSAAICIVRHEGAVLLIRHTYGDRSVWQLPGGHRKRGEAPVAAAVREVSEEVGVTPERLRFVSEVTREDEHRTVTVSIVAGDSPSPALKLDGGEIAEAGWFPLDALPEPLREGTIEALALAANRSERAKK